MTLFKNKYRIESTRRPGWNYSTPGYYFITICTKDRKRYFGEIQNGIMNLNEIGKIIYSEWYNTITMRPNIELDEFIIMPNHIHGIIKIEEYKQKIGVERQMQSVSILSNVLDLDVLTHETGIMIQNVSNIIQGFKSSSTRKILSSGFKDFQWQSRFHDRIIRDERELFNVQNYIRNNPKKWGIQSSQ